MKQHLLNRILPVWLRNRLRRAALRSIPSMRHLDMPMRLKKLSDNGFRPRTIFDIGASGGDWARMAAQIWPDARIFAFEPNAADQASLAKAASELPNLQFRRCFLGAGESVVSFRSGGVATSLLDPAIANQTDDEAPMLTIDGLIADGQIPAPDLMKLDVQGYELNVLSGATKALANCQAVLLEVSFLQFYPGLPMADEVIRFMREADYAWYDIAGCLRRPLDDALAQMDLLFVRKDHPLRASSQWD